jgi:hypothetical protein
MKFFLIFLGIFVSGCASMLTLQPGQVTYYKQMSLVREPPEVKEAISTMADAYCKAIQKDPKVLLYGYGYYGDGYDDYSSSSCRHYPSGICPPMTNAGGHIDEEKVIEKCEKKGDAK